MLQAQDVNITEPTKELRAYQKVSAPDGYQEDELDSEIDNFVEEEDFGELTKLDYRNRNDPTRFSQYANKIFTDAMDEDFSDLISSDMFLLTQKDITPYAREASIKWLYQVAITRIKCTSDALFSAIFYLDIVLCNQNVSKSNLQAIVVTCLWTAMKLDGLDYITLEQFLNELSLPIPSDVIIKTEIDLIKILNFRLMYPTSRALLRRFCDVLSPDDQTITECACFFCQIGLLMFESLNCSSSEIASSAIYSAFVGLEIEFPMHIFLNYTNITQDRIIEVSNLMNQKAKTVLSDHKHILYESFANNKNLTSGITKLKL